MLLHLAVFFECIQLTRQYLTPKLANVPDDCYQSPIYIAVRQGHKDIFKLLLKTGVDLDLTHDDGRALLLCTCRWRETDIVLAMINQARGLNFLEFAFWSRYLKHLVLTWTLLWFYIFDLVTGLPGIECRYYRSQEDRDENGAG